MKTKVSDWKSGKPPCDGIWQIIDYGCVYYARFKNGLWGIGRNPINTVPSAKLFKPFDYNNNPNHGVLWRGRID